MRYLILGDAHGNWTSMFALISSVRSKGIPFDEIIQVGDLGVYPGIIKPLYKFAHDLNIPIHFIDGNHEDFVYLHTIKSKMAKNGIFYHERGSVITLDDGTKIGWFGGAFNVDRQQYYINGTSNHPTQDDINNAVVNFNAAGKLDLLITHTCPSEIGIGVKGHPAFVPYIAKFVCEPLGIKQPPLDDVGDCTLTEMWNKLTNKPDNVCFGHFHSYHHKKVGTTDFYCVGSSDNYFSSNQTIQLFFYDTKLKKVIC